MPLPFEYRSAEVVSAEQIAYDDGTSESRYLMDAGLGQERILVVEDFGSGGEYLGSAIYSAERVSVYSAEENFQPLVAALRAACFEVRVDRYGLSLLEAVLDPSAPDYFTRRMLLEQIVWSRGEIMLCAPKGHMWDSAKISSSPSTYL